MSYAKKLIYSTDTVSHYRYDVNNVFAEGVEISLPGSEQFFLAITCSHGMLACRLADVAVSDRLNLPIAIFSAARLDNMLEGKPVSLSQRAMEMGATIDMTGEELVLLFSSSKNA